MEKDNMKLIYDLMPEGWKEAAKETKALVRCRNIKTPEELLRLNILYQTSGGSYGLTAALTQISDNQESLNKTAVQKRITNSAEWLQWLCKNLCLQESFLVEPPEWLKQYRVCAVDASDFSKQGSNNADFRLHYMTELFTLNLTEMYFTEAVEGEKLSRYTQIRKNDLILADRGYGTISGITHIMKHEAHYVLRLKAASFNLYKTDGTKFDLTQELKDWAEGKVLDFQLYCKNGNELIPVRVCAIGKTAKQFEKSQRQTKKSNPKRKEASELQNIWNHYIVVATSLPEEISASRVLELYRMRWQIELVFKRFKSIFEGRDFSVKKDEAVKSWFYGKLLVAIICETLVKRGFFSHEEYR